MKTPATDETGQGTSLFIVDTTYQLLNAIEAANCLGLSNSFLVIVNEAGQSSRAYRTIIEKKDWAGVIDVCLSIDTDECTFRILGRHIAEEFIRRWCGRYLHYRRMRRVAIIVDSFREVRNLFLGHYWIDQKAFMRHFANAIKHETLFILDDGTDIIDINRRRKAFDRNPGASSSTITGPRGSFLGRLMNRIQKNSWHLDIREAECVTFFTTYDLDVRPGDHLIKNEYRHLRSLAGAAVLNEDIYFLGQCLVEDGYMDPETYLNYLEKVKQHFAGEKIKYVPHPRESAAMVTKVHGLLGFEIKKFDVPIEYQLVTSGEIPKVVASFFCSALESCSNIFGGKIRFSCFYIYPEHLKKAHEAVEGIYGYFEKKVGPNFMFIKT